MCVFSKLIEHCFHPLRVKALLSMAAFVSLALGLIQDFGTTLPSDEPPVDWIEGVAIISTVLIVVS